MGSAVSELTYRVRDFSPGFLDTPEADTLPGGATPDARNADFESIDLARRRATLKKRGGIRLQNPTAMAASAKVDGVFEFRRIPTVAPVLLAVCNGKLFQYDNIDTFTQVGVTAPFTAGNAARACFFRNNAFIVDGAVNKRYDGTALYDVGQIAPTSVTNMSAVAPSGAGVSGTFEAYYVWYDPTMDSESSPSAVTSTTVLVAQARRHTKPGGAPSAQYTFWRAYVRRTDTAELNFFRAATVAIGTGTVDEELSDTARRNAGAGPFSSDNNPPPGAFAILVEWKGYFIGVQQDDDSYYVSKRGDAQCWNPAHRFPVARGDGEAIASVQRYGTDLLIRKGHQTYRIVGDTVPFTLDPLHSRWGGVSQESGLEVNGLMFDWDRENGPYRTDTAATWESLVRGRIANLVATVNRSAMGDIRAVYDETTDVIRWAIPVSGVTRKRLVLKYHVGFDTWLPPDDGMEYGSFCAFTPPGEALAVFMGDYWGRVYKLNSSDRDGVPTSSAGVTAVGPIAVTSATTTTVVCAGAAFYTTGSGLAGMPVAVKSSAGVWQWRRIQSNTATTITLDTTNDNPWSTVPDSTYTLIVGGIRWYHRTPWIDFGLAELKKVLRYLFVQGKVTSSNNDVTVTVSFDDNEAAEDSRTYNFPTGTLAGVWGVMVWGVGLWGAISRRMRKVRLDRSPYTVQFEFSNFNPDEPISLTQYLLTADALQGRKAPGVSE